MPEFMKPAEVAAMLKVGRSTVFRWLEAGILPAVHLPGNVLRVKLEDVETLVDKAS